MNLDYATVTRVIVGPPYLLEVTIGKAGPYRCRVLDHPSLVDDATGAATAGTAHTHPVGNPAPLAKGDRVLVGYLAGDADRPVVLGRLRT